MDDEISEVQNNPMDLADEENLEEEDAVRRGRGAPRIQEHWTRVISMSTDNLQELQIYPIATDVQGFEGFAKFRKKRGEPEFEIHFHPKEMIEKHPEPDLDKWKLKEERLKNYAIQITNIRQWIVERAKAVDNLKVQQVNENVQIVSKLNKKLRVKERKRREAS